ncbi:hypothetical protein QBC35DRAFT_452027 [Podospora australis]|uniref:Uncharacterized protein n=1 Tax=Podospora australis TaxID=1536484 RepID=A0AAN6WX50_9PEZI|nr:hypothetical protein QBC35DRAFT_452027 [Podospora australis]
MPTVQPPTQQEPMEAIAADKKAEQIVSEQPKPQPQMDTDVSMRGGGMNVGFTCCGGSCSFHKHCC